MEENIIKEVKKIQKIFLSTVFAFSLILGIANIFLTKSQVLSIFNSNIGWYIQEFSIVVLSPFFIFSKPNNKTPYLVGILCGLIFIGFFFLIPKYLGIPV